MYSPKIREDLIPVIFKLSKQEGKTMTRIVDDILRAEIERRNVQDCPPETEKAAGRVKKRVEDG